MRFAPSDNLILYGHNMKDGSMFADLAKYRSKDFWHHTKPSGSIPRWAAVPMKFLP